MKAVDKLIKKLNDFVKKSKDEKQAKKDIKITLDLFVLFERLSLAAPSKIEDYPSSLEALTKKKEWLLELRKQVTPPGVTYEEEKEEEEEGKEEEMEEEKDEIEEAVAAEAVEEQQEKKEEEEVVKEE